MSWASCVLCMAPNYQNVHRMRYKSKYGEWVYTEFYCRDHRQLVRKRLLRGDPGRTSIETLHDPTLPSPKNRPKSPIATPRRNTKARQKQVRRIAARDGWICKWCGRELSYEAPQKNRYQIWEMVRYPTIDHYPVRRADGGSNKDHNVVLSCQPCNSDRHNEPKNKKKARVS